MHLGRPTLQEFLADASGAGCPPAQLAALLHDVASAAIVIAGMTTRGALGGFLGAHGARNVHGETQQRLDVLAHEAVLERCTRSGGVAAIVSEEAEQPQVLQAADAAPYLLVVDPLDGSSNIDVNVSVGTIFSVLQRPRTATPGSADFLQPGHRQVAAGYAIYGPSTMLVLTLGHGTHGFTLDRERGAFTLTHPELRIADDTHEFAINTSNARFWEAPVQRYVSECQAGHSGARGRDFNMRWIASLVAEAHRILMRGGVFLYPRDSRLGPQSAAARQSPPDGVDRLGSGPAPARSRLNAGRLRLMYEANPVAWLVEQAGGRASTGRERLLDVTPTDLHQRVPLIFGSRHEVERIERYHHEHDCGADKPYVSPLFNERSLFRAQELA